MRSIEEKPPSKREQDRCKCESCKRNKGQPHKIAMGTVREYSATPPGGWRGQRCTTRQNAGNIDAEEFYLGVELETTAPQTVRSSSWCRAHIWSYTFFMSSEQLAACRPNEREMYRQHLLNCRPERGIAPAPALPEQAADMRRPKRFWVPKHDGSVTGPEFASQPATLLWWYAHKADMREMFTMLLHSGFRSHEGDKAGLHINISTSAFGSGSVAVPAPTAYRYTDAGLRDTLYARNRAEVAMVSVRRSLSSQGIQREWWNDQGSYQVHPRWARATEAYNLANTAYYDYAAAYDRERRRGAAPALRPHAKEHLLRFMDLIYSNKQWSRRMAQRTENSARHWAQLDLLNSAYERDRWADRALNDGHNTSDRYIALNRPNHQRFEFRLPRGTLRLDRFYKNLEWVHAMIEYTRTADAEDCTPPKFMAWVLRGARYPYLQGFINEKFAAQVERQKLA